MKILLVEAEPLAAFELTCVLEDAGHQVVGPAPSTALALSLAADEAVDLALMNVGQGVRDQNLQLAETLQTQQGTCSLFFCESNAHSSVAANDPAEGTVTICGADEKILAVEEVHTVLANSKALHLN